jgi:hypothetical protein
LRRTESSWVGSLDTTTFQSSPQLGENAVQSTINMEHGAQTKHASNLARRFLVFEAERQQQPVSRIELGDCPRERQLQLSPANCRIGFAVGLTDQLIGIDFVADEIFEPPAYGLFLLSLRIFTARASVTVAEVIVGQSSRHDDEPRRKSYVRFGNISAEPAARVFAESFECVSIRVHGRIAVTCHHPAGMEDGIAICCDELAPEMVAVLRVFCVLQLRQRKGRGCSNVCQSS